MAMCSQWTALESPTVEAVAYDASAGTLTATTGDFTTKYNVGDVFTIDLLIPPADEYNKVSVFTVTNVTTLVLSVTTSSSIESWDAITGASASIQKGQSITIGQDLQSMSISKQFLDLTAKEIMYTGETLSGFDTAFSYGNAVTQSYRFMGAGKSINTGDPVTAPYGTRDTHTAPPEEFFNASVGIPYILIDGQPITYCIESIKIGLDNGLTPKNCVRSLFKTGQDLGTAKVTNGLNMHLSDDNWAFYEKILAQDVIHVEWPVIDSEGLGYHYQINFQGVAPDGATSGKDSQVFIDLSGTGAIGDDGKVLTIWKLGGALPAGVLIEAVPVSLSGVVENAAPTDVVLTFSENISVSDVTGFTVNGSALATTVSTVTTSGNELTLGMNGAVANGETITVDYDSTQTSDAKNTDSTSLKVATFAGFDVTNSVV